MTTRLIIVGGVAAGMSAAAKARRCDEEASITVFEKGAAVSYANCGLPYYIGGVIKKRDELLIVDAPFLKERFNIDVRARHEVTAIDAGAKTVTVRNLESGETFIEPYDKLVLAPGADPVLPPIPGRDLPFVFSFKTLADTDALNEFIERQGPRRAVVVGGGLIGVEMVENLAALGMEVTVVEFLPQLLSFLDAEMAEQVALHMRGKGVELLLADKVTAILPEGAVETTSGARIPADLVILAVGIRPNTALARMAGCAIGDLGGIAVNERMETSVADIFAAGDCVESLQLVTGKKALVPMGSAANKEGRAAGANAMGRNIRIKGFTGTVIVKAFDLAVAKTGLSEAEAVREGMSPVVAYVLDVHHAGYYPGAQLLRIKTVADSTSGRLLGAQVVGGQGVDKRIDVLATAIYAGMQAEDLVHLDLAYAPPYGSARDPVIVSGMLHGNFRDGEWTPVSPAWLAERLAAGADLQIVDVRTPGEVRRSGRIPGAIHIPVDGLRQRVGELDPERETVLYCAVGLRSYLGSRLLAMKGFRRVRTMTGGIMSWTYPLEG
ncbi:MAG: FAD-dependent oxidoreductase [Thermodesulfobacteriota bacterium]